jgi:hypothetical protein
MHSNLSVLQHAHNTSPSLPNSRLDLVRGQRKPVRTLIPQLIRKGVCSITSSIGVIGRAPRCRIQGRAARSIRVHRARNSTNSSRSTLSERLVLSIVFGSEVTVVAIRREDILSIRVDVEVESDAARVAELVHLSNEAAVLGSIACCLALVGFGARAGGSAAGSGPLIRPIPVIRSQLCFRMHCVYECLTC